MTMVFRKPHPHQQVLTARGIDVAEYKVAFAVFLEYSKVSKKTLGKICQREVEWAAEARDFTSELPQI